MNTTDPDPPQPHVHPGLNRVPGPVFAVTRPPDLPGTLLDRYLQRGWYRMHQTLFTCRYLLSAKGLRSPIWTRLCIADQVERKSLRRRRRRIESRLQVRVRPFCHTDAHDSLYLRYRAHVGGDRSDSLEGVLWASEAQEADLFDTWEVAMFDGDRMVAFSLFDVGMDALMSIVAVYEPEYRKLGLGVASMLYEIDWARARGLRHHYAGYVVPGETAFEYKRDVGPLEAWLPDEGVWGPLDQVDPAELPAPRMDRALGAAAQRFEALGIGCERRLHPPFQAVVASRAAPRCMVQPASLAVDIGPSHRHSLSLSYDPMRQHYSLDLLTRVQDLSEALGKDHRPAMPSADWWVLLREVRFAESPSLERVIRRAQAVLPRVRSRVAGRSD